MSTRGCSACFTTIPSGRKTNCGCNWPAPPKRTAGRNPAWMPTTVMTRNGASDARETRRHDPGVYAPTMRVHEGCLFTSTTGGDEPMPSRSWRHWHSVRARELDEVEAAHTAIGGSGPGRRTATQQINRAYAVLLASQFQGFCRDLHTECVDYLVALIPVADPQGTVREEFHWN